MTVARPSTAAQAALNAPAQVARPADEPRLLPPGTPGYAVRATQPGYYQEAHRRAGDEFVLADPNDFSEVWMEKVGAPSTPAVQVQTAKPSAARVAAPATTAVARPAATRVSGARRSR